MPKLRVHNEYFRTVKALRCDCGAEVKRLKYGKPTGDIESVWSWGEYVNVKWRTVLWFCEKCWERRVLGLLLSHKWECGCDFKLNGYQGETLPEWLTIDEDVSSPAKQTNSISPSEGMCQK